MANESIRITSIIPADPPTLFVAWLDGAGHSAMTGSPATSEARVGSVFTAWDGYISGKTKLIEPGRRIVQAWRTTEFPKGAKDSLLEIVLEAVPQGTRVTLVHTNIPEGQGSDYEVGWTEYYLKPMQKFFSQAVRQSVAPPAAAAKIAKKATPRGKAKVRAAAKTSKKKSSVKAKARPAPKLGAAKKKVARKAAPTPRRPAPKGSKKRG
ncbi:MAG: SRPBCC domain-containing protein [Myxococcales bacterium]|nr:SRPBCC domain-containing protein [Myxococcales bacterium]